MNKYTPTHADRPNPDRISPNGFHRNSGKMRPMILLWALGIPIPIILIIVLLRGCLG